MGSHEQRVAFDEGDIAMQLCKLDVCLTAIRLSLLICGAKLPIRKSIRGGSAVNAMIRKDTKVPRLHELVSGDGSKLGLGNLST